MWRLCLGLGALLCRAEQHDLHRKLLDEPAYQVVDSELGLVKPSQGQAMKTRAALSAATSKGVERMFRKLNTSSWKLPIPATMLTWTLTGKLTEWAMDGYKAPKTQAQMDLADSFVALFVKAFDTQVKSLSDKEMLARLLDWAQIHEAVHRYSEASGQLPEVTRLVDATAEVLQNQTSLDLRKARGLVNQIFDKVRGEQPVADLLRYTFAILTKQEKYTLARLQSLMEPALTEAGAPPALTAFVKNVVEQIKQKSFDPEKTVHGALQALLQTSQQLSMPLAFTELFESAMHWVDDDKHSLESLVSETQAHLTAAGESIGYPTAVASLPSKVLQCLVKNEEQLPTIGQMFKGCVLVAAADAGDAVGEPPAVTNMLRFLRKLMDAQDDVGFLRQAHELCEGLGLSHDVVEYADELDRTHKSGVEFDESQRLVFITKLLRLMGMPAISSIMSIFGQAGLDRKKPTEQNFVRVLISLFDIPGDFKRVKTSQKALMKKVLEPVLTVYRHATLNLTRSMMSSPLSAALSRSAHRTVF